MIGIEDRKQFYGCQRRDCPLRRRLQNNVLRRHCSMLYTNAVTLPLRYNNNNYYYYKCIDLSDTVTQALQGHCTHNK